MESKVIFVTGCNSHYFKCWMNLYNSIISHIKTPIIYFYDLGINLEEVLKLKSLPCIHYEFFDFDKYPEWVNVKNNAGQWAWKAQCIIDVMNKYLIDIEHNQYLLWCDSRNRIDNSLTNILSFLDKNGIYTNATDGTIRKWTVDGTINYLNGQKYVNNAMKNAALPCFNINIQWVREFISDFSKYSLVRECIFPTGSNRLNHRQDQSVLTILFYIYKDKYNFNDSDFYGGISIHTIPNFIRPFPN
jgi:hypothetical protein